MTLCLSNYGDKCCKLYVLMFGLWLFSRFTPPLSCLSFSAKFVEHTIWKKFKAHYIFCCKFVNIYYLSLPQTTFQRDNPSFSEITSPIPNTPRRRSNISFLLNLHKSSQLTYCYLYWELYRKIADEFLMWSYHSCMWIWPEFP